MGLREAGYTVDRDRACLRAASGVAAAYFVCSAETCLSDRSLAAALALPRAHVRSERARERERESLDYKFHQQTVDCARPLGRLSSSGGGHAWREREPGLDCSWWPAFVKMSGMTQAVKALCTSALSGILSGASAFIDLSIWVPLNFRSTFE